MWKWVALTLLVAGCATTSSKPKADTPEQLAADTRSLAREGIAAEPLRHQLGGSDLEPDRECGRKMRAWKPRQLALEKRAKALNLKGKWVLLGAAITNLRNCLVCSKDAKLLCELTIEDLQGL